MNIWFALSPEVQLALLFVLGTVVGGQINRGVYRLAWFPRLIGPWSPPHADAPPRRWFDRLPVIGWIGLRRESPVHGAGFWVRPLAIEFACGAGFAALYWWEMQRGLLPLPLRGLLLPDEVLLAQFFSHIVLLALMAVATFIDFDEKTIPDEITVPGALLGLILAACLPLSALPIGLPSVRPVTIEPLLLTSPLPWPQWLDGAKGLLIGIACLAAWCAALVPKTWTTRRGWSKALQYAAVSCFRSSWWWKYLLVFVVGSIGIASVWVLSGPWWKSLLSSLVGMAFGGGMIWAVRIVGSAVLDKEAMGFGDVTLMAMIGAFLGWQPSLLIFFMAPFAALFVSVALWLFTRRRDIAFGPYLCVAALFLIVRWSTVWHGWAEVIFRMGWFVPQMLAVCLVAMAALLLGWRKVEEFIFRLRYGDEGE